MRRDESELELYAMGIAEELLREIEPWGPRCEEDLWDKLMDELVGTRWARRRLRRWAAGEEGHVDGEG